MFEEYYGPLPDRDAYLERIGLRGEALPPTAETLHRLVSAHIASVPFENLDVYERGLCPDLSIQGLFDKIVVRRRGGYCFELNGLFQKLLEALGYSCYSVVMRGLREGSIAYPAHRGLVVSLPEGKAYCDVGFGGAVPFWPAYLDGTPTPDGFRVEKCGDELYILAPGPDGGVRTQMFVDVPAYPVDFIPLNIHMSQWPESYFRMKHMASLRTENGGVSIDGDLLRIRSGGQTEERKLRSRAELYDALREHFGIELPIA